MLGVYHEQQRSDRDNYINLDQSNVIPAYFSANYAKSPTVNVVPYHYGSVMHYGATVRSYSVVYYNAISCH